ncbi:V-type proton ATPase subunit G 1 [Heterocephalus glaber]|uniref:V-type proton ATPase subunit G n=1 Tax=Heterocephalus glaber TaxID=10181 RepID=G5B3G8_HETGA|nr:V-type proton ATPase subunit G 1 [Heterocephalus glaber]
MASQSQGIQQLLQAEKQASEVSEARKREKEFKAKEAAALGSQGSCSSEVEKETQEKMAILQTYFQQNRGKVLDNLLAFVCDIRPEIHENYRINGQKKETPVLWISIVDALTEYKALAKLISVLKKCIKLFLMLCNK